MVMREPLPNVFPLDVSLGMSGVLSVLNNVFRDEFTFVELLVTARCQVVTDVAKLG